MAVDIIADLLHWFHAHGLDADEALDRAQTHFEAESEAHPRLMSPPIRTLSPATPHPVATAAEYDHTSAGSSCCSSHVIAIGLLPLCST